MFLGAHVSMALSIWAEPSDGWQPPGTSLPEPLPHISEYWVSGPPDNVRLSPIISSVTFAVVK